MGRITYQIWLLSYYREAELRGADLLQRLLRKTEAPDLQLKTSLAILPTNASRLLWRIC